MVRKKSHMNQNSRRLNFPAALALLLAVSMSAVFGAVSLPEKFSPTVSSNLTMSVTGAPAGAKFQWKKSNVTLTTNATSANYFLGNVTYSSGGAYSCVVTGNATFGNVTLTSYVVPQYSKSLILGWGNNDWGQTTPPSGLAGMTAIAAGTNHSLAVRGNGTVIAWGDNSSNQTAVPPGLTGVSTVAAGGDHSLALKSDGTVVAWGSNSFGESDVPAELAGVTQIAAGTAHSLALLADGTVVAWGDNSFGQATVPPEVVNVAAIVAAGDFSLALGTDGTVYSWGDNSAGQLDIAGLGQSKLLAAGQAFSLSSLLSDGSVVVSGDNTAGQLDVPDGLIPSAMAGGGAHTLAIDLTTNKAAAWGDNTSGQATIPAGLGTVTAVAAGGSHSLALKSDGTIVAWGDNTYGQSTVPGGFPDAVVVSAGGSHTLALKKDGTVVGWGNNDAGQTDVPAGLTGVVAVSGGSFHSLALKSDGTVVAWGDDSLGQATVPPGLANVISIAAGGKHSLALTTNGTVVAWGDNAAGQCTIPTDLTGKIVVAIAAGADHSLAVRNDGKVVAWGSNLQNQCSVPTDLINVVAVAGGYYHSLALKSDKTVVAWGSNGSGQTTVPGGLAGVTSIAAGGEFSMALSTNATTGNTTVAAWGSNTDGQTTVPAKANGVVLISAGGAFSLSLQKDTSEDQPPKIVTQPLSQLVASGSTCTFTVMATGDATLAYQWRKNGVSVGAGGKGVLVSGVAGTWTTPVLTLSDGGSVYDVVITNNAGTVTSLPATITVKNAPAVSIASGNSTLSLVGQPLGLSANATGDGTILYQWKRNGVVIPGATASTFGTASLAYTQGGYYSVDVTDSTGLTTTRGTFVLPRFGRSQLAAWGSNSSNATTTPAGLSTAIAISSGSLHSLALTSNGTAVPWGSTASGLNVIPVSAVGLVAVSAGGAHSLALTMNGTVRAWGSNTSGQTSVPSTALSGVTAIAAGGSHSLALAGNGTVLAWGANTLKQSTVPAGLSGVSAISAGFAHSMALTANGSVVCWGDNASGQTTVPAAALSGVTAIAAGGNFSMALKANGSVVAWGSNTDGQTSIPAGLSGVIAISAGGSHALALRSDGSVVAWGSNASGQGTVPSTLANVAALAAGGNFSVALRNADADTLPVIATQPAGLTIADGTTATFKVTLASGSPPITYQWRRSGVPVVGGTVTSNETSSTYTTSARTLSDNGTLYSVVVSNDVGNATSSNATLLVKPAPVVPLATALYGTVGQPLTISSNATGQGPLTYQWTKNGAVIPGATSANYTVSGSLTFANGGFYSVTVTDTATTLTTTKGTFLLPKFAGTQIFAWGSNISGETTIPSTGMNDVVQISAGGSFALALRGNGTVAAWGLNTSGQTTVPPGLTNVVSVAAGGSHSLALTAGGTITAWGSNASGQVTVPPGLSSVIAVAAGANHSLALTSNGTVVAWGDDANGQATVPEAALSGVTAIAAGANFSLALKTDNSVIAWGYNGDGQTTVPASLGNQTVSALSGGVNFSLALTSNATANGTVTGWGSNSSNQTTPVPADLSGVTGLSAGSYHTLAVTGAGKVFAWGWNQYGQTDVPADIGFAAAVSASRTFSLALCEAVVPSITIQPADTLSANGTTATFSVVAAGTAPLTYSWSKNGTPIASTNNATYTTPALTLANSGSTYSVTVSNPVGSVVSRNATLTVKNPPSISVPSTQIFPAVGQPLTIASTSGGEPPFTYQWQRNGVDIPGATSANFTTSGNLTFADGGYYSVTVVDATTLKTKTGTFVLPAYALSQIRNWGSNTGNVTVPSSLKTQMVAEASVFVGMAAGKEFGLALTSNATVKGKVVAWGANGSGQTVVPASALSGMVAVSAGDAHSLALAGNGTVLAWGSNTSGQATVPAAAKANVVSVAAGAFHSVALLGNGTVVAWGSNSTNQSIVPAGLSNVVGIAAGGGHTLALRGDGTVVAWGDNTFGQATVPAGLTGVTAVSAGALHSLALLGNGTVVAWGSNSSGQTTVPAGLAGVTAIAAGGAHSLALKADGTVTGWGYNGYGQATPPVGLNKVGAIAAGYNFSYALRDAAGDVAPAITTQPASKTGGTGQTATFTVVATGGEPLTYQWSKNGTAIAQGGTSAIYTTPALVLGDSGSVFSVVVTNDFGNATSTNATLTVQNPPTVTLTSSAVTTNATVGGNLTLTASASGGTGTLKYQWKINGLPVAGQTGAAYTITGLQAYAGGYYSVDVSDDNLTTNAGYFVLPKFTRSQVRAWGSNSYGQADVPAGLNSVLVVGAGSQHVLAISADSGTVTGWGSNEFGQINIPAGLTGVVAVAGGSAHSLALTQNQTVVAWGWNGNGQTTIPFGLSEVTGIAAGANHSLAVRKTGFVTAWGDNASGQSTVPADLQGVATVAAGSAHSLALKSDGTVRAWGLNSSNQTAVPAGLSGVVAISAGDNHSLALTSNGTVVAWGANESGQSTVPDGLTGVVAIAAGANHSLALKSDGSVVAWGADAAGQSTVPSDLGTVGSIAAGGNISLAVRNATNDVAPSIVTPPASSLGAAGKSVVFSVTATGSPTLRYQWRLDSVEIPGATASTYTTPSLALEDGGGIYSVVVSNNIGSATSGNATLTVVDFSAEASTPSLVGQPLTLTADTKGGGTLTYQWKRNGLAIPGATSSSYTIPSLTSYQGGYYSVDVADANSVNTNGTYVLPQYAKSQVRAWGSSSVGQTGVPAGVVDTVLISAGFEHSLALSSDGEVRAWGSNQFGQTTVPFLFVKAVMVSAGGYHSLALTEDGNVSAWGANGSGQTNVPAGLAGVVEIAAGANHSLALTSSGTVVGWGNNDFGQTNVPAGLTSVIAISAGANHSLALLGNGTVVAWGQNSFGQATVPAGLANVVAIAAGGRHSLALVSDGTVVAWGDNSAGQTTVPDGLASIVDIAAGDLHSVALRSYGTVAAWGSNASGQCDVPAGMTSVGVVSAGGAFSLALRNSSSDITDTKPVITPPAPQGLLTNAAYSYQVVANPAASLYLASGLSAPGLGLSINATTGLITGTPTQPGVYPVTLSAQNSYGLSVPVNIQMTVGTLNKLTTGSYLGIVGADATINNNLGGSLKLTLTSSGNFTSSNFTGQLVMGTATYQLKGTFNSGGNATVQIPKTSLTANLNLTLDSSNGGIIGGTIGDGTNSVAVSAEQLIWNAKARPATAYVGAFNMLFKPDAASAGSPQGYGFATAKIDAGGVVRISGRMSDNTAFSSSGSLWGDGVVPVSIPLYSKKGSLLGALAIDSTVATRPLSSVNVSTGADGTVRWVKLATGKGNLYPAGFTANLTASGSEYLPPPKGTRVIGLVGTTPNAYATANFSSGNATATAVPLTVSSTNTVPMSQSTAPITRFSINASTGAFTGSFATQNPKRTVNFQGLLIGPTSNIGRGFFLMPGAASSDPVISREIKFAEPGK